MALASPCRINGNSGVDMKHKHRRIGGKSMVYGPWYATAYACKKPYKGQRHIHRAKHGTLPARVMEQGLITFPPNPFFLLPSLVYIYAVMALPPLSVVIICKNAARTVEQTIYS